MSLSPASRGIPKAPALGYFDTAPKRGYSVVRDSLRRMSKLQRTATRACRELDEDAVEFATDDQQPATDNQQPTTDNRQLTTDN